MSTVIKHKTLPITISYKEYAGLSKEEQVNFVFENKPTAVHNHTNVSVHQEETSDLLGLGKVAETGVAVALLPLAIVGSLFK